MVEPWHRCHLALVCEKQWSELTPTADARVRHCSGCERTVHEVATPEEFAAAKARWQCVRLTGRLTLDIASPLAVRSAKESGAIAAQAVETARAAAEAQKRELDAQSLASTGWPHGTIGLPDW